MVVADQIVDSSITNNNSNNNREVDDDFKRVNEVLETLKARVFQPTFFSIKNFPAPQNVHPKRSASKKLLVLTKKRSRRCALSRAKRTSATPLEVKIFEIFGGPLIFRRKDPCRIKKGEKKVHFCRFFLFFARKFSTKLQEFCNFVENFAHKIFAIKLKSCRSGRALRAQIRKNLLLSL